MHVHYRPTNGRVDYVFDFQKVGSSYRIFIVDQPAYPSDRNQDAHATHRLGLGSSRPYVCWTDPIPTLEQAKTVAASWAENTERYIATGVFPLQLFSDWNEMPDIVAATRHEEGNSPTPARPATPPVAPTRLSLRTRIRERVIR